MLTVLGGDGRWYLHIRPRKRFRELIGEKLSKERGKKKIDWRGDRLTGAQLRIKNNLSLNTLTKIARNGERNGAGGKSKIMCEKHTRNFWCLANNGTLRWRSIRKKEIGTSDRLMRNLSVNTGTKPSLKVAVLVRGNWKLAKICKFQVISVSQNDDNRL